MDDGDQNTFIPEALITKRLTLSGRVTQPQVKTPWCECKAKKRFQDVFVRQKGGLETCVWCGMC